MRFKVRRFLKQKDLEKYLFKIHRRENV